MGRHDIKIKFFTDDGEPICTTWLSELDHLPVVGEPVYLNISNGKRDVLGDGTVDTVTLCLRTADTPGAVHTVAHYEIEVAGDDRNGCAYEYEFVEPAKTTETAEAIEE